MLGLLSLLWLSAWSSAQAWSLPSTASLPVASAPLSEQLDDLATRLEQALTDSETDWEILSATLTELSLRLDRLATSSRALERESESMRASLRSLGTSLEDSTRLALRYSRKAGLWRAAALSGIGGLAGALLGARPLQGAAYGAGFGALAAGAWFLAELRLPFK